MTPQDLFDVAYAKSVKFQPGKTVAEDTEGLSVANRVVRTFFQIAARVNPTFFGVIESINYASPGWARPALAESIYRLEELDGTEVVVVPFDQRDVEDGKPAVFRFGQVFRTAGNALDPTDGALNFYYSKLPTDATQYTGTLDPMWPDSYAELAALEIACYMAAKERDQEELAYFVSQRDAWLRLYLAFLEHETANEREGYGALRPFNTGSLVPIASLLTGGTSVKLANAA